MSVAAKIPVPEAVRRVHSGEPVEFRRRVSKISRHSLVYFAGALFSGISGYLFKIYVARALGAEALGIYALGISIVSVIGLFNAVGLPTAGGKFVAEYSTLGDYVRLGAFLRGGIGVLGVGNLILGVILVLVAPPIAVHFYHAPALAAYSWAFAAIMLIGVLNAFLGQCMAGYQAVARRSLITQFAGTIATITLASLLIHFGFGLKGYLAAQVGSAILVLGLLCFSVWKFTPPEARSQQGFGRIEKRVLAFSAISFGLAIVHFILGQADKIALGRYLDVKQVGIYAVAMTVVGFIPIALTSVNQIFSPTIAELNSSGDAMLLQRLYASLTKWVLLVTAPLAVTVMIFSHSVMAVFGPAFQAGAIVLSVGAAGQIVNCAVGSVGYLLLMSGHQSVLIKIEGANAVVVLALNIVLVPRFGILGAAIAISVGVVGTNLCGLIAVKKKLGLFPYNRGYLKLIATAGLTVFVLLIEYRFFGNGSWTVAVPALASAYFLFFGGMLLLGFDHDDRMLMRLAWQKFMRLSGAGGLDE